MTLFADEPDPEPPERHAARCRRCRRILTDEASLGYSIGPTCRERLGITPPASTRPARVRSGGDVPGQTLIDLEETDDQP